MPFVHAGKGNYVATERVLAIVGIDSEPVRRMVRQGKASGVVIDCTHGRRTKAAVLMDTGAIVLVAITPETLVGRGRDGS